MSEDLTRVAVKHQLLRAHNERVAAREVDDWPDQLWMHPFTHEELLADSGGFEGHHLMDFEGKEFMGIPVICDVRLEHGQILMHWPNEPAREEAS